MAEVSNKPVAIVLSSMASLVSLLVLLRTIEAGRSPAVIAMASLGFLIFLSLLVGVVVSAGKR